MQFGTPENPKFFPEYQWHSATPSAFIGPKKGGYLAQSEAIRTGHGLAPNTPRPPLAPRTAPPPKGAPAGSPYVSGHGPVAL